MARGDPYRLSFGILVPNYRFLFDSDYLYNESAIDNIPDGWTKLLAGGTLRIDLAEGPDGYRALYVSSAPSGNTNDLVSSACASGSIPQTFLASTPVRMVFRYSIATIGSNNDCAPFITWYNRDESLSYTKVWATTLTPSGGQHRWLKYDSTETVPWFNAGGFGFLADHLKVGFRFSGISSTARVFRIGTVTPATGILLPTVNAYDTITATPEAQGTGLYRGAIGRFERGVGGMMRYFDPSGGAAPWRGRVRWADLSDDDRGLLERAWQGCRGQRQGRITNLGSPVEPSPILIEPFQYDDPPNSSTPIQVPENLLYTLPNEPQFTPLGEYLSGLWTADFELEEVCG